MKKTTFLMWGIALVSTGYFVSQYGPKNREGMLDSEDRRIHTDLPEACVNGVVYYLGYQLSAVKFNPDGNIETCAEDTNT